MFMCMTMTMSMIVGMTMSMRMVVSCRNCSRIITAVTVVVIVA